MKTALEACKEKWYNEGFADAENSVEPVVYQAQLHGFGEGNESGRRFPIEEPRADSILGSSSPCLESSWCC